MLVLECQGPCQHTARSVSYTSSDYWLVALLHFATAHSTFFHGLWLLMQHCQLSVLHTTLEMYVRSWVTLCSRHSAL